MLLDEYACEKMFVENCFLVIIASHPKNYGIYSGTHLANKYILIEQSSSFSVIVIFFNIVTHYIGTIVEQQGVGSHILTCFNILDSMKCTTSEESR